MYGDEQNRRITCNNETQRYDHKKDDDQKTTVLWILAIIGAVAAVAAIAYAVYCFFTPDYLEDFEEDFDDDFDNDFFSDEDEVQ